MENNPKKQKLNNKQEEASNYLSGPLLILAGAGAGKTKTIVERVINIIKSGVEPYNILCVTFTNKAAAEMRERIIHRMQEEGLGGDEPVDGFIINYNYKNIPTIKTFHSLGLWILKREYQAAGLVKNFTILDSDDTRSIIKNYLDAGDYDTKIYDPTKIRGAISREKADFKTVEDYKKKVASYSMEVIANSWEYYNKNLKDQSAVDFDDLIVRVVDLLKENPSIKEKYQNLFKYVHVDEYQDTNASQYELTKLLISSDQNICVVGDTDQNIYSWRGANLRNIMNFENDYKKVKTVLLEENYRSTGNILELANTSIKKNTVRKDKRLFTNYGDGDLIQILPSFDGESEAENIAINCKNLIAEGYTPENIAILYRTNFQSRLLEEYMLSCDVPYTVLGIRFFERKEVKDILSYLKLALNEKSQMDLKRVLEYPKKGFGKATLAKIFANEDLNTSNKLKLQKVFELIENIRLKSYTLPINELLTYILIESGIEKDLHEDGEEGLLRLANINELITLSEKYVTEKIDNSDDAFAESYYSKLDLENSINNFLELSSLSSDQDDDKKENAGVRLMTIHASKGLEFDCVFIAGLEQDLFPSKNFSGKNRTKEEEEEERRLFYVAVTRARKKLFLTFAEMRTIFGQRGIAAPSEFLSDLPHHTMNYNEIYYKQRNSGEKYIYI